MTAPGRYCLAVCYCGGCPHYKPLPPPRLVEAKAVTIRPPRRPTVAHDEDED